MIVAGPGATRRSEFVRQDNNAAAQRLGTGQGELGQRAFSGQQVIRVAAADEERMDPQSELIQQATFQQRVGELTEAVLHDVLARLIFEPGNLGGYVAADNGGVVPFRPSCAPS